MAIEAGSRRRNQPAPPHVLFEALTTPHRDPYRPWLILLDDEQQPTITTDGSVTDGTAAVIWSGLWLTRPDATVRFDLPSDGGQGCDLRWTLFVDDELPDPSKLGHLRKRVNQLINANLRLSFGQ